MAYLSELFFATLWSAFDGGYFVRLQSENVHVVKHGSIS